ncbi:hypothetical protein DNTS_005571 [Danionella cerebrum]|uniref:Uncharacterized protein n=1 Tax=Danionella cerebrum TaxID=2873325 RepID=A0A553NJY2_9TELE|nr:hypothetical protein DNTS_005571 [Danionella translucida]
MDNTTQQRTAAIWLLQRSHSRGLKFKTSPGSSSRKKIVLQTDPDFPNYDNHVFGIDIGHCKRLGCF